MVQNTSDAILQAAMVTVAQVLLPILMGGLVILIKALWGWIKSKMSAQQLEIATTLINQLVLAAEQNSLTGMLAAEGQAKKKYVIDTAEAPLAAKGIHLDLDVLDALIESSVYEAFNKEW